MQKGRKSAVYSEDKNNSNAETAGGFKAQMRRLYYHEYTKGVKASAW